MTTTLLRRTAPLATAAVLGLGLSACGSSDAATDASTDASADGAADASGGTSGTPGTPGTSGLVAAVDGDTAQVQGDDGQTAVSWTDETTFTEQVDATLADVTVGSCVVVTADPDDSDSGDSGSDDTAVTAAAVRISPATDGECSTGWPGGGTGGAMPQPPADGELPTDLPTDLPIDMPDGAAPGGGRPGAGTAGTVTAVSDSGFTVEVSAVGAPGGSGSDDDDADADAEADAASVVTVSVGDATTYTLTVDTDSAAVEVDRCVSAQGESDDTGAVVATSIAVSDAVDGECTGAGGGFGGPGGGRGGAPGQAPDGSETDATSTEGSNA